jgi:hypothetical protein
MLRAGVFDGAALRRQDAAQDGIVRVVGESIRQLTVLRDLRQLRGVARQRTGHQAQSGQDHPAEEHAVGVTASMVVAVPQLTTMTRAPGASAWPAMAAAKRSQPSCDGLR